MIKRPRGGPYCGSMSSNSRLPFLEDILGMIFLAETPLSEILLFFHYLGLSLL